MAEGRVVGPYMALVWKNKIWPLLSISKRVRLGQCSHFFHTLLEKDQLVEEWKQRVKTKKPGKYFYEACKTGHMDMIHLAISKKSTTPPFWDWNWGLKGACEGNQMEVIQFLLKQDVFLDYEGGFYTACACGHLNIVQMMMHLEGDEYQTWNWNCAMHMASYEGHMHIVQFVIKHGANNWQKAFETACSGGHMDMVQFMIEKGATGWNMGLFYACRGGHMDIVQLMLEKGANFDFLPFHNYLLAACEGGDLNIVKLCMENNIVADWNECLHQACWGGHLDIVHFVIKQGADDWHGGLVFACRGGYMEIVQLMIDNGANNWDESICALRRKGSLDILEFLKEQKRQESKRGKIDQ